ncbi:exopolysaccharide production repressor protein [Allomesorhizobium camelthorni]|uniref:Exopolysaccharide production repressor protein exox n=1 Tax=Allomesorhizobium camelthorni TaxID=475069 RepID=A0A6G4WKM0_9HYPH|nr:exopolysaccharide production repressor protein [Mesorhizobium camelthorni]NGO54660.1 exopolysaccharide production repressor protein exox [Mesorhizobium camelthorni]
MSFPLFFRGLFGVLVLFAATTYCVKQSVWTTTIQTLTVAVLLQVGYFIGVLMIVWRSGTKAQPAESNGDMQASPGQGGDGILSIHDGEHRMGG